MGDVLTAGVGARSVTSAGRPPLRPPGVLGSFLTGNSQDSSALGNRAPRGDMSARVRGRPVPPTAPCPHLPKAPRTKSHGRPSPQVSFKPAGSFVQIPV